MTPYLRTSYVEGDFDPNPGQEVTEFDLPVRRGDA
jgi:hypothetical protein